MVTAAKDANGEPCWCAWVMPQGWKRCLVISRTSC